MSRKEENIMQEYWTKRKLNIGRQNSYGSLGSTTDTSSLLRTIWSGYLPTHIQPILAAMEDKDLDDVAEVSDSIIDSVHRHTIASATPNNGLTIQNLVEMVNFLTMDLNGQCYYYRRFKGRYQKTNVTRICILQGLRYAVIIGSIGTTLGSWIKVAAVAPDRFWVAFLGQAIVALSQIFILSIPARLAAVWFGPSQVSSACSIGVFGNQMGIAIGFLIPPMIVNSADQASRTHELYILFGSTAVIVTFVLMLILIFFKEEPPTPPSLAQVQAKREDSVDFVQSLKRLLSNLHYVLLLISYGINVGVFYAISTLLNQIVLKYYPNGSADAGRIGLVIVLAGMVGSVICGYFLDKYHKFKETNMAVYVFSLIGMVVFTFTLNSGIGVVYFTSGLLGFFMTGLMPIGFELAAELTFPEPEGTSAGLLNAASQVFGIAFTNIYSVIFENVGTTWSNIVMSIFLLLGAILLFIVKPMYRRQNAQFDAEVIKK
ncbi:uncharacterized MFS-type transporter C09D4.1-like [Agrilus planipennis]|uniref:Uncharacterized MFS-type transporter C09D4.1-like n=1 Tax=Agrilus planipennis TaxID=224129 RepID=A0A7F5RF08_AGRPL|nr:uncharacterized MFS-type transporter C09D4.1-like [Agrilus planipennis]